MFVERQTGGEVREPNFRMWEAWDIGPPVKRRTGHLLPVPVVADDGVVTKVLLSRETEGELLAKFDVAPEYLPTLLAAVRAAEPPAYLTPPRGAVRWREPAER